MKEIIIKVTTDDDIVGDVLVQQVRDDFADIGMQAEVELVSEKEIEE